MFLQMGLGRGFVVPLLATAMIASGASAALVAYSTVITNNTSAEKTYELTPMFTLTSNLGNTGGSGSLAIVVSDIRGGGAYIKSVGLTPIYTSFINAYQVATLTPSDPLVPVEPFGQASFSAQFTEQNYGVQGNINDIIKMQLKFILSVGDQAVISATFEVNTFVPTPGAVALIFMAGGFGVRGRRRSN
ncbi:MAG: hypothetical protein EXS12_06305 [Phycisphaerales bacterium]|nr:hypothetical protein [Phycisphaerales bacterium]